MEILETLRNRFPLRDFICNFVVRVDPHIRNNNFNDDKDAKWFKEKILLTLLKDRFLICRDKHLISLLIRFQNNQRD